MPSTRIVERKCIECGRYTAQCRKCGHKTYCEFCNRCNVHGQDEPTPEQMAPQRERPRGRLFVAEVAFFINRGWTETYTVRVHAQGVAGAMCHAVRTARRTYLTPRTRVRQVRVTLVRG